MSGQQATGPPPDNRHRPAQQNRDRAMRSVGEKLKPTLTAVGGV